MKLKHVTAICLVLILAFLVFISCAGIRADTECADEGGHLVQTSPYNLICVDREGRIMW